MPRSIEELNASFEQFKAGLKGEAPEKPEAAGEEVEKPKPVAAKTASVLDSDTVNWGAKNVERAGESSKIREANFGKIDASKYGAAFDAALQMVSKKHDKAITKADQRIYYTEVVEGAVKSAQLPAEKESGPEIIAKGFILKTLAGRLKRSYENAPKEPGEQGALDISIYSSVGSDLEKDKGVVAIVECATPHSMIKEKFYLTTKGYKRNIAKDEPERSYLIENFQGLGVRSISVPIPFDGFEEKDLMTVLKGNLPNKICDAVASKMIGSFQKNRIFA